MASRRNCVPTSESLTFAAKARRERPRYLGCQPESRFYPAFGNSATAAAAWPWASKISPRVRTPDQPARAWPILRQSGPNFDHLRPQFLVDAVGAIVIAPPRTSRL